MMQAAAERLRTMTSGTGRSVHVDGPALLGERAAIAGLTRRGAVSCGGSTRLLRAADGWLAVALPRPDDLDLLPAWIGVDDDGAGAVVRRGDRDPAASAGDARRERRRARPGRRRARRTSRRRRRRDPHRAGARAGTGVDPARAAGGRPVVAVGRAVVRAAARRGRHGRRQGRGDRPHRRRPPRSGGVLRPRQRRQVVGARRSGRTVGHRGPRRARRHRRRGDRVDAAARPRPTRHRRRGSVSPAGDHGCGSRSPPTAGAHRTTCAPASATTPPSPVASWRETAAGPCSAPMRSPTRPPGLVGAVAVVDRLLAGGRWLLDVALARVGALMADGPTMAWDGEVAAPRARPPAGRAAPLGRDTNAVLDAIRCPS